MAHLKPLTKLELLILSGTGVTDAGLKELVVLKELWGLSVTGTRVTAAGAAELHKALPKCQIDR